MFNTLFSKNLSLLILLSAIWGSAFIAIKIAVEFINPISIASFRLIIASIFLLIFFIYKKYKFSISLKDFILIIFIGIIGNIIPFVLINWSEQYIQSNTTALLLSVAPIFTLILSPFLTKDDKFSFLKFVSISVGFIGVILIIGFETLLNLSSNESNLIPKISVILAALGYVISSILAYYLKHISTIVLTTFVISAAAIISIPFMIFSEIINTSSFNQISIFAIIYLGLFPTAIAFQLRFYIISKAGPIFLSYVAYLIPVFAIIWSYIFLKESINLTTLIGTLLVLLGVFIGQGNSVEKISNKSISN